MGYISMLRTPVSQRQPLRPGQFRGNQFTPTSSSNINIRNTYINTGGYNSGYCNNGMKWMGIGMLMNGLTGLLGGIFGKKQAPEESVDNRTQNSNVVPQAPDKLEQARINCKEFGKGMTYDPATDEYVITENGKEFRGTTPAEAVQKAYAAANEKPVEIQNIANSANNANTDQTDPDKYSIHTKTVTEQNKPENKDTPYTLRHGESPYDIATSKYGAGSDALAVARALLAYNGCDSKKGELPKGNTFNLPDTITVNGKPYKLNNDAEVKGTVTNFSGNIKYVPTSKTVIENGKEVTKYYFKNERTGEESKLYNSANECKEAMDKAQTEN